MGGGILLTTIPERTAGRTFQVFLSSTVKDLETYRSEVQDVLIGKAQIACFPSEEWTASYGSVLTMVRKRLSDSNGYFLIAGYW